MLIIEIDGSRQQVAEQSKRLKLLTTKQKHCTIRQAETEDEIKEIWMARRSISAASYKISPNKTNEDVVVPRSLIPELVHFCEKLSKELDIRILTFGHAGDGNIHVNIMAADSSEQETKKAQRAKASLFHKVISMKGTLSGEHGVGITKSSYIDLELSKTSLTVMRQIKHLFDPNNILNPGKIFPDSNPTESSTHL